MLQKNIQPGSDLGLLVVDEEHRFGVAHKERIKQLKQTIDVLTLTATPIPRTLQMSFTGAARSLGDPHPAARPARDPHPGQSRFDGRSVIREAILREVRRGGQVLLRAQSRPDHRVPCSDLPRNGSFPR